jgi:GNAT superfamily N-acetyltransferase
MEHFELVSVTDEKGAVIAPDWLARAERVHRQLRTALPTDYAAKMSRVFADGGRLCVATEGMVVRGVAVYRVFEDTFNGLQLYVDDLVTDEAERSRGVGHALLAHLERIARRVGCFVITLDSGTQRHQAHKFYFREGMVVSSFHFAKQLE